MILTCGEALIDMIPGDDGAYMPHCGGSVFNTAIALARLGAAPRFFTGLSDDLFGQMLTDTLAKAGVDTSLCPRLPLPTTLAFVQLNGGDAEYTFYDRETAGRSLHAEDLPEGITPDAGFFGGISLISEPCGTSLEVLFHRLHNMGTLLMLDPNIRPGFIANERIYRKRLDRMLESADIVKLSDKDLEWLMGPGSITEHCETLLDRGPMMVVVTEGADGARAHTARDEVFVAAQRVDVVDTIGAGDTFNAGLLAGLAEDGLLSRSALAEITQNQLRGALELANKAAGHVVAHSGAKPPTRDQIT